MLSPSAISPERCPDTFPKRQPQRCILDPHSDPAKLSPCFQFLLPPRSPPLTLWLTIAPQFFLVLTPSKLTSFQLSPTTPALRGFSPLLCSPKLLPTNRRSNWSLIKALSGVSSARLGYPGSCTERALAWQSAAAGRALPLNSGSANRCFSLGLPCFKNNELCADTWKSGDFT